MTSGTGVPLTPPSAGSPPPPRIRPGARAQRRDAEEPPAVRRPRVRSGREGRGVGSGRGGGPGGRASAGPRSRATLGGKERDPRAALGGRTAGGGARGAARAASPSVRPSVPHGPSDRGGRDAVRKLVWGRGARPSRPDPPQRRRGARPSRPDPPQRRRGARPSPSRPDPPQRRRGARPSRPDPPPQRRRGAVGEPALSARAQKHRHPAPAAGLTRPERSAAVGRSGPGRTEHGPGATALPAPPAAAPARPLLPQDLAAAPGGPVPVGAGPRSLSPRSRGVAPNPNYKAVAPHSLRGRVPPPLPAGVRCEEPPGLSPGRSSPAWTVPPCAARARVLLRCSSAGGDGAHNDRPWNGLRGG
ncbi:uncharacterized protein LOC142435709 [Tenrec ecaudatus]|uniref:uncharacterized protein LOC142434741 n=1 Tax=Tenrec ecaudatus TaxID=94439 RepID=UPI003F5AB328